MRIRIRLARLLIFLGRFIESLPVVVMKPDELVEFSRQTYARPDDVESWTVDAIVDAGLSEDELELLSHLESTKGKLLLLGVGGGREAIPLAKLGFQVTGVDFVPEMVQYAIENANRRGIKIDGIVQEISRLDVDSASFDIVWLSRAMYSCVPTRKRRVDMVRRIAAALKPGGFFLCQFHWDPSAKHSWGGLLLHRIVALVTLGNWEYEEGDILWSNVEFIHAFRSEEQVLSELQEGGLSICRLEVGKVPLRGSAICQKLL